MIEEQITQRQLLAEISTERRAKREALLARVKYLHRMGLTTRVMGERLGMSGEGASRLLKQLGLKPNREDL